MEGRSGQVAAIAILFLVLTWITVGLRCYVRIVMIKGFGLDDKLMVLTLLFFTAYSACQLGGAFHGTGVPRAQLTDEHAQIALRYWFFCEIFYTISTSLLKIAVGYFLLRITVAPIHIWIIRIIMMVAAFLGVAYTALVVFQCRPMSYWWELRPDHHGKCLDAAMVMNFTYLVSALNSFADWTFGCLPILIVKDLQMKTRMKVVVSGVIALAAIGSTATIIRLPYTSTLKPYKGDFLYRTTDFAIWTTVEVGIGISAGCIATLKPLLKRTFLSMSGTRQNSKPWSRSTGKLGSKLGFGGGTHAEPLDALNNKGKTVTVTTVTGGRASSSSDEENILDTGIPGERWDRGINKCVTTTIVAEDRVIDEDYKNASSADRVRSRSSGGDSESTLDGMGRGKPAVRVHERF